VADALALYMEAFWRSPWDCAVHVALREKGLEFHTSISMIREGVGAIDALRARTITGTAPVLQHGSFWVAESMAIVEYIEDAFPPPHHARVLPADVRDRARCRQVMSWVRTTQEPLRRERDSRLLFYTEVPTAPLTPAAQSAADKLLETCARLGVHGGAWVFGDFTIADVDLAFSVMRLVVAGEPVPDAIAAYARRVWARPSVHEFVTHPRPPHLPLD
jgi:glutathione S-transferase